MADEWFYWADDKQVGPIGEAELKAMAGAGTLRPEDLIWNKSMHEWLAAGHATDWKFGPPPALAAPPSSPQAVQTLSYVARSQEPLVLSPRVIDLLCQTRPWVKFFAILTYACAGLFVVVALVMIVMTAVFSRAAGPGIGVGVLYILLAAVYCFPASYLNRYASHIAALTNMRRSVDLEEALDAQRAFWKFCGVLAIVIIGVYLIGIAIVIAMR